MKIGVGIIGGSSTGWAAVSHLPALAKLDDYELVAVSTTRFDSALQTAKSYGIAHAFDDYRKLLSCPAVDLVVISVKVPLHFELAMAAIEQGKNVLCEWPLGKSLQETTTIAAFAQAKGVVAAIGLQARSSPAISCIKRHLAQGYVGRVLSSTVMGSAMNWANRTDEERAYLFDRKNGATMLDIACGHMLDAFCFTLGEFDELVATGAIREPQVEIGKTGRMIEKTSLDQLTLSGPLVDGTTASFHYRARASRGQNFYWEINGTEGDLVITADSGQFQFANVAVRGARGRETLQEIPFTVDDRWSPDTVPAGRPLNIAQAYLLLAQDLRNGTRIMPRFDDAVVRHRMLDAIERSIESGCRQTYDRNLPQFSSLSSELAK